MILVQTLFRLDIDLTMNPLHWPVLCLLQRRVCHGSDKNRRVHVLRFFYLLILVLLVGAVGVFAYQNAEGVNVQFLNWAVFTPVAAVADAAYLIGMVSGWTVVGIFRRSLYRVTEPYQERR
jgi:lipopolysaccharide assembly protein A